MKKHCIRRLMAFLLIAALLPAGALAGLSGLLLGMPSLHAAAEELPGYANPDYTFTSVDEASISSKGAAGQTTVLVFGHTRCGNTSRTLRSIADSSWVKDSSIRVIFAECNFTDANTTRSFANTYANSYITACYDLTYQTTNAMWAYFELFFKDNEGGAFPFVVLIDGNNRVRNMLSGYHSADAIKTEIDKLSSGSTQKPTDNNKPNETEDGLVSLTLQGTENYTYVNTVLRLVNQTRAEKGLPALALDKDLTETAMQRAAEISLYYDSGHLRPDGTACFTASSRGTYKAENIAVGYPSPDAVMAAWKSSEGHYANIMSDRATSIGIGCFQGSDGILNWVQFFDNAPAVDPALNGTRSFTRTISIKKSLVGLRSSGDQVLPCSKQGSTISLHLYHYNSGFDSSKPELALSNFSFSSSDPSVASVSESGVVTLLAPGSATITASLRSDPTVAVTQVITMGSHSYKTQQIAPTLTAQGYTLHTCSICQYSYQDAYVPSLSDTSATGAIPLVSGFKATSGQNSIKLSWSKVSGADGYYLYQYNNSTKKWKRLKALTLNTTSYTVKSLSSGTAYLFAVKAFRNQDGKRVTEKPYTKLYTATKPEAVDFSIQTSQQTATITWKQSKGSTGYLVYYKTRPEDSWKRLALTKDTSYTVTDLKAGQNYIFTVRAYKTYKGQRYYSTYYPMDVTIE